MYTEPTPQKSNIKNQNSNVWKQLHFPNHIFGIYVRPRGFKSLYFEDNSRVKFQEEKNGHMRHHIPAPNSSEVGEKWAWWGLFRMMMMMMMMTVMMILMITLKMMMMMMMMVTWQLKLVYSGDDPMYYCDDGDNDNATGHTKWCCKTWSHITMPPTLQTDWTHKTYHPEIYQIPPNGPSQKDISSSSHCIFFMVSQPLVFRGWGKGVIKSSIQDSVKSSISMGWKVDVAWELQ